MIDTTILDEMTTQSLMQQFENADGSFDAIRKDFVIDDNVDYPEPEYLIRLGEVPTLPKGNIVALSAKWKNGKTFFCDILAAIFLGSTAFHNCENLVKQGKVLFFDTEQAVSDTARIRKTIKKLTPQERHKDFDVFCLRKAGIDSEDEGETISRYEFIVRSIERDHPDLVIVDGIADLIYNYNDVYESQMMVNKLATVASDHDCCVVVVMHQNKGKQDKTMKGHIGTMLYQKASDVFNIEKHGPLFIASHSVSRHRQCDDIVFKLDEKAVPIDAAADRQLQLDIEHRQELGNIRDQFADLFPADGTPVLRKTVVDGLVENLGIKSSKAYQILKQAEKLGLITRKPANKLVLNPL